MKENFPNYHQILDYCFDNFSLSYSIKKEEFFKLTNHIKKREEPPSFFFKNISELSPVFFSWKNWNYPVFFFDETSKNQSEEEINFDVFLNLFLMLSGWQEWKQPTRDIHCRFRLEDSLQYKHNFVTIPVVSIYYELLFDLANKKGITVTRINAKSPVIFTHDIDQLRSGWLEDIRHDMANFSIFSLVRITKSVAIKLLGAKDSYYRAFEEMMAIEKGNYMSSIGFFMTKKSHLDADHEIEKPKYLSLMKKFGGYGEIGLHPGYDTFQNKENWEEQKNRLEKLTGKIVTKSRQHFLKFDCEHTSKILEENHIQEDYSLGFVEMYGFRNSSAQPFYLYNFTENSRFETKEIPLFFMDSTLIDYLKTDKKRELTTIKTLIDSYLSDFNCCFSILFHNTAFSNKKYSGFTEFYKNLISK